MSKLATCAANRAGFFLSSPCAHADEVQMNIINYTGLDLIQVRRIIKNECNFHPLKFRPVSIDKQLVMNELKNESWN